LLSAAALLSSCASNTSAILESAKYAFSPASPVSRTPLNPAFRYLRVTIQKRVALLVLGYVEDAPGGAVQVWYSAQREVLRIQNGRLVGAVGLTIEWHGVRLPELPSWSDLARINGEYGWVRVRDVMPSYRYGVRDHLSLRRVEAPARTELQGVDPAALTWFEEHAQSADIAAGSRHADSLPVARYAVDARGAVASVVYGEQCLSTDLCFAWQRWPAEPAGIRESR